MKSNPIVTALIGYFLFTLMDLNIKGLLQKYNLMQVAFFNTLFALVFLLIWIFPNFKRLKTTRPSLHFSRAIALVVCDLLIFYSFGQADIASVYTLLLTMPLFTVAFSILWAIEKYNHFKVICSIVGFCGALLVLSPSAEQLNPALLAAFFAAAIEAGSFILIAKYKHQETAESYVFYSFLLLAIVSGVLMIPNYMSFELLDLGWSIFGGLTYTFGFIFVTSAFLYGKPSSISGMQYSQLPWGILLAFLIWQEIPSTYAIYGSILVVISGLVLIYKESN